MIELELYLHLRLLISALCGIEAHLKVEQKVQRMEFEF